MGIFQQFPYSNFHDMNLDEIIKIVRNMLDEWSRYHAEWDQWMSDLEQSWSDYQNDVNAQWAAYQNVMNNAWQNMQNFINNYFDNLDVQDEINNKIVSMIATGEFQSIVDDYIPPTVSAWLDLHITEPVGVVIDTSLTVAGACADAKATGDAISDVKSDLDDTDNTIKTYLVENNILYKKSSFSVGAAGLDYQKKTFYTLTRTFSAGDRYTFTADSIVGNTNTTSPFRATFMAGTTQIREATHASNLQIEVQPSDISAGLTDIVFYIYASTSIAQTQACIVTKLRVYTGFEEITNYTDTFKEAVQTSVETVGEFSLGVLADGFVNSSDGSIPSATTYKVTDYIPIKSNKIKVRSTSTAPSVGLAFYNSAKQYISGVDFSLYSLGDLIDINVPDSAKYFVYCAVNSEASNMSVVIPSYADAVSLLVDNPCKWVESDECRTFKKILCIGDSLTEGAFEYTENGISHQFFDPQENYPAYLKNITGRDTTNAGDSGESTVSWYALHGTDDLSGHDACVIALGRNDYIGGSIIPSADRITAMNNIIAKVKSDNPQIKIFICTQFNYYSELFPEWSAEVNDDMRSVVANTPDCYLIDLATYADFNRRYDSYSHLTAVGYCKLARMIFNYISWIMHMNYADFKIVQFIGTNRSYT